ncbi:MAG TPA: vWA domain-containing protein [Polyangiaceae bacterium]|nr:vWA domain-containing protein [Polyangiaceae bacterium]
MLRPTSLRLLVPSVLFASVSVSLGACGSEPQIDGGSDAGDKADAGGGTADLDVGTDNDLGDADADTGNDTGPDVGGGNNGPVCEQASSEAELQPIFLAFAFDVSGSMGQKDKPRWWHDKTKKWDPVVASTSAFFEDADSSGVSASMVFFPAGASLCSASSYAAPEVTMRELPSTSFRTALDGYIEDDAWRGNTPTRYALEGARTYIEGVKTGNGSLEAKYAVVLVTDGEPAGCTNNTVSDARTVAQQLLTAGFPVYVIGILNPTDKPAASDPLPTEWGAGAPWDHWGCNQDGTSNANGDYPCNPPNALNGLNDIASFGGTNAAVLIDTNDTEQAKKDFKTAIDSIRSAQLSCNVGIPPNPQGGSFDKDRINVSVSVDGTKTDFAYDPECTDLGSWHYDDAADPQEIILCDTTCADVQSTPGAQLNVDFLCQDRPDVVN